MSCSVIKYTCQLPPHHHLRGTHNLPNASLAVTELGANLALGRPMTMSSQHSSYAAPSVCVDGQTNGDSTTTVCHTNGQVGPWLEVELAQPSCINMVKVWNRQSCCQSRLVPFHISLFDANHGEVGREAFTSTEHLYSWKVAGTCGVKYVEIKVDKTSTTWLHLSEVEVFGVGMHFPLSFCTPPPLVIATPL